MGQMKCKLLKTRHFLRLSARNCGLHLGYFLFQNNYKEQNIFFIKYSNTKVSKQNVDSF